MPQRRSKGTVQSRTDPYTAKAAGAETTSTAGPTIELLDGSSVYVEVAVTATGGTPTMTVVVEGSPDGGTTWFTLGTIGANGHAVGAVATAPSNITAAGTYRGCFPAMQHVRTRSVIGGASPSLTYSVAVEALG